MGKIKKFFTNLLTAPVAATLGVFGMIGGARSIFDKDATPIAHVFGPLVYIWSVVFFLGGLAICLGMGWANRKLEAAGCALFVGGAITEGIAFANALGWTKTTSWVTVFTLLVFALGMAARWWKLMEGYHQIWIKAGGRSDAE